MTRFQKTVVMACVLALSGAAWGQATSQPAAPPKPILEAVPAGAAGFVVVSNVEKTLAAVSQYLKDIGVAEMAPIPPDLLEALKGAAQLGEGFNPKGGFALVVMDPAPLGIDLEKMITSGEPPKPEEIPIVGLVPGSGVQQVFGSFLGEGKPEGDVFKLKLGNLTLQATQVGGYIALSPCPKALAALKSAGKSVVGELPKEQAEMLARSHGGLYVNMKVAGPLYVKFLEKFSGEMGGGAMPEPMAGLMKAYMGMYGEILKQVQGVGMALRFDPKGLVFEEMVTMVPDSPLGKAMAAGVKAPAALDRLPNLPYGLALGTGASKEGAAQYENQMADSLVKLLPKLSPQTAEKIKTLSAEMNKQVTAVQFVAGGPPAAGKGLFGVACVMTCQDAEKLKALLGESVGVVQDVIRAVIPDEDVAKLQITYTAGAEKVGSASADVIEINHPDLDKMGDSEKAEMAKVLGEAKLRLLVAAADKNTLVVTFGGGPDMMAEALKVAGGTGAIPKDEGVVEVLKQLPKDPVLVCVVDVGNILKLVRSGAATMGEEMPPFNFSSKSPIGLAAAASGSTAQVTLYVPNQLVKDVVGIFTQMMGPRRSGPPRPVPGGEAF